LGNSGEGKDGFRKGFLHGLPLWAIKRSKTMKNDNYNYKDFKVKYYTLEEFPGPKPGENMIDIPFLDMDGHEVRLKQLLDKPLVLENGSLTCPLYTRWIKDMNALAKKRPDVNFAVAYVREAHPGERTSYHKSLEEKLNAARKLKKAYGEHRKVLVDSLDGLFHKTYGTYPNSIYVFNTDGIVVIRGVYAHIELVEEALESIKNNEVLNEKNMRPGLKIGGLFFKTLYRGGFKAFWDFILALKDIGEFHRKAKESNKVEMIDKSK
jgi:hypothetical protein